MHHCNFTLCANVRLQVLRYSALAFGVFYGYSHQRTITATQKAAAEKHVYEHKQQLIEKAKAEFAKKKNPASVAVSGGREYNAGKQLGNKTTADQHKQ